MLLSLRGFTLLSFLSSFVLLSLVNHVNAEPKVVSMQTTRMPHSRAPWRREMTSRSPLEMARLAIS
jgi:hypothetical protein